MLKKLGYTTGSDDAIDNDKISAALGIYNCKFTAKTAKVNDKETPNAEVTGSNKVYTVTVTATPYDSTYVWDDGAEGGKDISFDVSLNLK
ncbi:P35 family lipoprotein [Malacoplasma penetrans]|uniref:P35 family lipoprotein n=1 Tax=Malacoplasma penetrans TaxID=28227 RepID=UPI002D2197AD|nr:P35 family lipoprotein [Malacoplasma penetrans]